MHFLFEVVVAIECTFDNIMTVIIRTVHAAAAFLDNDDR